MYPAVNALRLEVAVRAAETLPGGGTRSGREYLDFVIDEVPLGDAIRRRGMTLVTADLVSVLVTNWPGGFPTEDVLVLVGERASSLADGRVPLYVCPECGDLGCGAVTASIEYGPDVVTWSDFGWQTDYDDYVDHDPYDKVGPFVFDRTIFDGVLRQTLRRR